MKTGQRILLLGAILLSGCGGGRDASETSFRVIDAPANYVRRPLGPSETTTTTTTTTVSSDAVTPGRTVNAAPPQRRSTTVQTQPNPTGTPRVSQKTSAEKSKPSPPPPSIVNPPAQYPTAKPVPGKAGYVFSPYDPSGGYVDVSGYAPGSKVKDPYSGKIFFVP